MTDLLPIFEMRRHCFAELCHLALQQRTLIEASDYTRLLSLQGLKQRVIGQLEAVAVQHPRLTQEWKAIRASLPPAAREACEQVLSDTEQLAAQLVEHERSDTACLSERRNATRRELQELNSGIMAHNAYGGAPAGGTHRILDIEN